MILMESIVILIYLAEKSARLLPMNYIARMEHLQWLAFQASHIGPMFGQFGHFYFFAGEKTSDDYGKIRYSKEVRRLLKVLDNRLQDREYLMGDYSIVDIATVPWVRNLDTRYEAAAHLGMEEFTHVQAWQNRVASRPAYIRGKDVCKKS